MSEFSATASTKAYLHLDLLKDYNISLKENILNDFPIDARI